jgi:hypothetical protein
VETRGALQMPKHNKTTFQELGTKEIRIVTEKRWEEKQTQEGNSLTVAFFFWLYH